MLSSTRGIDIGTSSGVRIGGSFGVQRRPLAAESGSQASEVRRPLVAESQAGKVHDGSKVQGRSVSVELLQ